MSEIIIDYDLSGAKGEEGYIPNIRELILSRIANRFPLSPYDFLEERLQAILLRNIENLG